MLKIKENPIYWQLRALETEARFTCIAERVRILYPPGKSSFYVTDMSSSDVCILSINLHIAVR